MFVNARKIIHDNFMTIMDGGYYDPDTQKRCRELFDSLQRRGVILSNFEDDNWKTTNEVEKIGILLSLDEVDYLNHGYKYLKLEPGLVKSMLKYYTAWCMGEYGLRGIAARIRNIKKVLELLGEKNLKIRFDFRAGIKEFFEFIGIQAHRIESLLKRIAFKDRPRRTKRKLQPMITYMAAAEKSRELMLYGTKEERLHYFPVYWVTNFGAKMPERPTEWIVMPYECLEKNENGYFITVRKTILKHGGRQVEYTVEHDYCCFQYAVPYTEEVQMLEWYLEETKKHQRRFLFDFDENSIQDGISKHLSLDALNMRIAEFVETYLNNTHEFDWVKRMCNVTEFHPFPVGDMRPLALINLYYSGASLDVCMELADHDSMEITYHYITNIKEAIENSAFMKIQRKINEERNVVESYEEGALTEQTPHTLTHYGCNSLKILSGDMSECDPRCLDERKCTICRLYKATDKEIEIYIQEKREALEARIADMQKYIKSIGAGTFDRELLKLQKAHEAYADACMFHAEMEYQKYKEGELKANAL